MHSSQEKRSFQTEVKQLLDIMIHSLYSNKEIFLRELISNASDAIDKLRFEALNAAGLYEADPTLQIRIDVDTTNRTLMISDNGIGMNHQEVIDNLGTIAKSGTREFLTRLTGDQKKDAHLIGQFGVGFYSAFMVADKVTVHTRRAGLNKEEGVIWESTGDGEYTIGSIEKNTRGTDIILHLKKEEDDFLNDWRLRNVIKKYSDHLNISILMRKATDENNEENTSEETAQANDEWETVNEATALWTLSKNAVTQEQYHSFYKLIAHDFKNPLAYTHHRIEGANIDYTCLLYLPEEPPFDLWQRDNTHRGLKLYVQRVFILDEVEQFMPLYLRFIRGVLDTTALPLNISREILQDHPSIPKLRSALTRHVLDLLEKMSNDDPEKYKIFWKAFGNVLKEGPAEDYNNREKIAKLFRFATTGSNETSLSDYISRMKPKQTKIYFITAENMSAAKSSPHLEIFNKHDIEVLLLTDRIDEWVIAHLPEFQGKAFQSVAKGDLALDEINETNEVVRDESAEKKEREEVLPLLERIQKVLADKIKEVRVSKRLTSSPACLIRDDHALGPQMERLLKATGQAVSEVKPIFEINKDHALIRQLEQYADEQFNDWTYVLFEQALLAEGSSLPDPAAFVQRMNKLWLEQH